MSKHQESQRRRNQKYYYKNLEKMRARGRAQKDKKKMDPGYAKAKHLMNSYGITVEQHKQMYLDQDGCCALCEKSVEYSKIHTDHNHVNGKVRGLLCARCNIGMGWADQIEFIERALLYKEENDG